MEYQRESHTVVIDAGELASYARRRGALQSVSFLPAAGQAYDPVTGVGTAVPFSLTDTYSGLRLTVSGKAETVITCGTSCTVEVCRENERSVENASPFADPSLFARGAVLAYLAAAERGYPAVTVRLTFTCRKNAKYRSFDAAFERTQLGTFFRGLLSRALPFARLLAARQGEGAEQLERLKFPYGAPRATQKDFLLEAFRTVKSGGRLLVSAPTGTGKTMAALYPAVKSMAFGQCDKVFYLTAKTVTGLAALHAMRELSRQAPALKCIPIYAKERFCPTRRQNGGCRCLGCPLAGEADGVSYEERRDPALIELFREGSVFDADAVTRIAEKYKLCPYELSLDTSEWCDVIVCDYNYAFDLRLRFRRYFGDEPLIKNPVFLVDEAHNLPDRAREMYSFSFSEKQYANLLASLPEWLPGDSELEGALRALLAELRAVGALCGNDGETADGDSGDDGEDADGTGFYLDTAAPERFRRPLETLAELCRRRFHSRLPAEADGPVATLYGDARKALAVLDRFDSHYRLYAEKTPEDLTVRLLCLDPSATLREMLAASRAAILFSATLSPLPYFMDLLGCGEGRTLDLPSPYVPENLCLLAADYISTRFSDRGRTGEEVAEAIALMTEVRPGHYLAYFPSYQFLKSVGRQLVRRLPGIRLVVQRREMSIAERNRFLAEFDRTGEDDETVLGLCVLGGIFSEGIDLQGDRLIGAAVVGIGLGGLSSESNLLEAYFDETRESGKEYAYVYPGINRVLQAAGRVIRGEEDRGVVLLIDDRYNDPGIRRLFPFHWQQLRYVGDPESLEAALTRFWEE